MSYRYMQDGRAVETCPGEARRLSTYIFLPYTSILPVASKPGTGLSPIYGENHEQDS